MVGVAVIGAGNWGKNLVRNFASLEGVALKYVCDLSEKTRKSMSQLYPKATVTEDMSKAIGDKAVDAVVVAVDAPRHYEVAKQSLQAGKIGSNSFSLQAQRFGRPGQVKHADACAFVI